MWGILFLIFVFLTGLVLTDIFFPNQSHRFSLISAFIFGSILSVSYIYFFNAYLFKNLFLTTASFFLGSGILICRYRRRLRLSVSKLKLAPFLLALTLGGYLMAKTFGYNVDNGQFLIASHVYSDFGVRIPFIRSFSLGNNFPFEVPFFAGSGLMYHFMFDLYAGILEFLGLRIDLALNLISALAFACLLLLIYEFGRRLFSSRLVGSLAVAFFLFPSDLSLVGFLKQHGLRLSTFSYFWHNTDYWVNSHLGINTVATFISLNNFLNQRLLSFGLLFGLFIVFIFVDHFSKAGNWRQILFLALLLGLFPFWHAMIFLVIYCWLIVFALVTPAVRKKVFLFLVTATLIALPQISLITKHVVSPLAFSPGFLMNKHLTLKNFFTFWALNLGLALPVMVTGFFFSQPRQKKVFLISLSLFIVPNLFRFSQEIFDNHKFFNLWLVIVNCFSALAIVFLLQRKLVFKVLAIGLIFCLTLSGLLHFLVVKNDVYAVIVDYPGNSLMTWMRDHLPPNQTVLTNGEIYDPASLVGQKIFLGRSHHIFTYSGEKLNERIITRNEILQGGALAEIKKKLEPYQIEYSVLYQADFAKNTKPTDYQFFRNNFQIEYEDVDGMVVKLW